MTSTDPHNHRLVLALGCFIENLCVAAGAFGLDADIRQLNDDFFAGDMVAVTLKKTVPGNYPLERLASRKTVKNGYLDDMIGRDHLSRLSAPVSGHFFFFPMKSPHGKCIVNGAVGSFRDWLDSAEAQREHARWLRIANRDARARRDGLTTEGMEIKGLSGWFVRSFFSREDFQGAFMKKESMNFVRKTAREGAGYAIVTGYGRTVGGMLELGRRFERMALLAREMNIGIQPMTQMLEMPSGNELIGSNHGPGIDPQMILRMGYVRDYPEPVTLRRPLSGFVRFA